MRKKISYVYISSFSKEFSEFLQYRISAGSDGIEERYVLKLLDKTQNRITSACTGN